MRYKLKDIIWAGFYGGCMGWLLALFLCNNLLATPFLAEYMDEYAPSLVNATWYKKDGETIYYSGWSFLAFVLTVVWFINFVFIEKENSLLVWRSIVSFYMLSSVLSLILSVSALKDGLVGFWLKFLPVGVIFSLCFTVVVHQKGKLPFWKSLNLPIVYPDFTAKQSAVIILATVLEGLVAAVIWGILFMEKDATGFGDIQLGKLIIIGFVLTAGYGAGLGCFVGVVLYCMSPD